MPSRPGSPRGARPERAERDLARAIERSLQQGARALYRDPGLFDQLYRRRSADIRCYVELAGKYGGPVLELGVGSGRVAAALARAGHDVLGVDFMESMLAQARARCAALPKAARARVQLRRGDLRRLRLRRRFPLVIAPFNTLMHLYTRRDLERAFASCRRHLAPGGRLIFDVMMPDLRALTQDPARLYRSPALREPGTGQRLRGAESSHYDALRQVRTVTMVFEREDGALAHAIPLSQRQLFPAELEALLHYNGFAIERRFGDFAFGPLRDDSEVQLIVARARRRG
jgi:SAM-dependent methyltransferase